jgi:hypothetical protein
MRANRYLILSALLLALSALALVFVQVYPVSSGPPSTFATALPSLSEFAVLGHAALSVGIATVALITLIIALKRRSTAAAPLFVMMGLACLSVAAVPASWRISWLARRASVRNLAEHAVPLVGAVAHFAQENDHPPRSLEELVPHYLSAIPNTGLRGCPHFAYEALDGEDAGSGRFSTGGWELRVPCPQGMLNWDTFLFRPSRAYPERAHGGSVEEIAAGWAYVHE